MKSGFVSIIGKPNVGKSSLMNAMIGEKVSIVSPKPQTTRDRIMGILTTDEYQMVFVDTPGVHNAKSELGQYMNKAIKSATLDVDAIILMIDVTKPIGQLDTGFIEKYLMYDCPVYVVLNKIDLCGYEKTYPLLAKLSYLTEADGKRNAIKEIIPISCRSKKNVDKLKEFLVGDLEEGDMFFPSDDLTDKNERYIICEIVREKALWYLQDEIPHGIGVSIQTMKQEGNLATIEVDIMCEKDSHKHIIIGTGGEMLKKIGEKARLDIERMLGTKVFLKMFVKVRQNWRNKKTFMNDIGYNSKKNF